LLQQVELVGGQHDEFLVGEGECPISVGILLVLDVASEIVAWDNHVCGEEDVDGIVDRCTAGNDLGVVGVEVGVEQLDVSLDGGAIGRQLPQIGAQGLGVATESIVARAMIFLWSRGA
jgi:hypothetical protein